MTHLVLISECLETILSYRNYVCLVGVSTLLLEQRPAGVHIDTNYNRLELPGLLIASKILWDTYCLRSLF